MKLSKNWHNFLFGWRRGTGAYLISWFIVFSGLSQLLNGADTYLSFVTAFCAAYFISKGVDKCGFTEEYNKEEYINLK